jgi:hypothetical protein
LPAPQMRHAPAALQLKVFDPSQGVEK